MTASGSLAVAAFLKSYSGISIVLVLSVCGDMSSLPDERAPFACFVLLASSGG